MTDIVKLKELLARQPRVSIYGPCSCDGFSFGHEKGCDRKEVSSKLQYNSVLAEQIYDEAPALLDRIEALEAAKTVLAKIMNRHASQVTFHDTVLANEAWRALALLSPDSSQGRKR